MTSEFSEGCYGGGILLLAGDVFIDFLEERDLRMNKSWWGEVNRYAR